MIHAPPRGRSDLKDPAQAFVDGFDGLHGGFELAGVADHVRIGEIHDDGVEIALLDGVNYRIGDAGGGHFRLQIVGGNFRRGHRGRALRRRNGFSTPPLKK